MIVVALLCSYLGPEGVARGEDALTILENPQSRNQFIDELMEVNISVFMNIAYTHICIVCKLSVWGKVIQLP